MKWNKIGMGKGSVGGNNGYLMPGMSQQGYKLTVAFGGENASSALPYEPRIEQHFHQDDSRVAVEGL